MAKYILGDIFQGNFEVTQYYGQRPEYYRQFGLAGHEGVDFGTPTGTPILAPFDAKIIRDNDDFKNNAYGNFIVIWDPIQKCAVWDCHLNDNNVSIGDVVKKGQVLGHTDNTGNSSGAHLHFNFVETDANGNRLNTNNGFQGFLNALDPSLVEWKLGGQQQTTPIQPSNDSVWKQVELDQTISFLFSKGLLSTDDSTKLKDKKAVLAAVQALKTDRDNNAARATKWDQVCLQYGITDTEHAIPNNIVATDKYKPALQKIKDIILKTDI